MEAYAVVGFYSLLLGIISFADAGLSSAITREFATSHTNNYKYSVLLLIEKKYALICFIIAFLVFIFAPLISEYWLTSQTITITTLTYYIRLIGVGVSIQLISSLYFGAMFGLHHQVQANSFQLIWIIFRSLGAVVLLILISNTLEVFFIWQIICNVIYLFILRTTLISVLKRNIQKLYVEIKKIPYDILKYVGGMSLVAIISSVNSQIDKIVVSSSFSLSVYGYFTVASSLSQVPTMLGSPLVYSLFPKFTNLVSEKKIEIIRKGFEKSSIILNSIVFITALCILFYTEELMNLWLKNSIEESNKLIIRHLVYYLTIGNIFLALQLLFYYILLSHGETKYTLRQGIVQIGFGVPLLYFLVNQIGIIGAGIYWILINLGSYIYLYIIVWNKFVKFNRTNYIIKYSFFPLFFSSIVFVIGRQLFKLSDHSFFIYLFLSSLISVLVNLIFYNYTFRHYIFNFKNTFNFFEE